MKTQSLSLHSLTGIRTHGETLAGSQVPWCCVWDVASSQSFLLTCNLLYVVLRKDKLGRVTFL